MQDDLYRLVGDAATTYWRARASVTDTLTEAFAVNGQDPHILDPDKLAEAILARLVYLDPPMLTVSLEEVTSDRWMCEAGHRIIRGERPEACPTPVTEDGSLAHNGGSPCGAEILWHLIDVEDG